MVKTRRKPLEESNPPPIATRRSKRAVKVPAKLRKDDVENVVPNRRTRTGGTAVSTPLPLTRDNLKKLPVDPDPAPVPEDAITVSDCSDTTLKAIRRQKFFSVEHHGKAETLLRTAAKRVQMEVQKKRPRKRGKKPHVEPREVDDDAEDIYCFDESQRVEEPPEPVIQKLLAKQKAAKRKARKPRKKVVQADTPVKQPDKVQIVMNKIKENVRRKKQLVVEEDDDHFMDPEPEIDEVPGPVLSKTPLKVDEPKRPRRPEMPEKPQNRVDAVMSRILANVKKRTQQSTSLQPIVSSTPRAEKPLESFIHDDEPSAFTTKSPRNFIQSSTPRAESSRQSPHPSKSPWRIQEENRVPHTKYFSFAKDLLPSYSSDSLIVDNTLPYVPSPGLSTKSPNNSDMENISPSENPKTAPPTSLPTGARIPLRPLRRLIPPSPLVRHSVNRVQVLANIPVQTGYRVVNNALIRDVSYEDSFPGFDDDDGNASNFFGFDDTPDEMPSAVEPVQPEDLRTKLTDLRHLAGDKLGRDETDDTNVPNLFLSPAKRQNNLVDMFQAGTSKASEFTEVRPSEVATTQEECTDFDLFNDPEKMFVTQAEELRRKSYSRPVRQRKRVHYSDYETEPDSEDEEEAPKAKAKKKKTTKTTESTEEYKKFVSEFNSMCEEVENFEGFVIEKVSPNSATETAS